MATISKGGRRGLIERAPLAVPGLRRQLTRVNHECHKDAANPHPLVMNNVVGERTTTRNRALAAICTPSTGHLRAALGHKAFLDVPSPFMPIACGWQMSAAWRGPLLSPGLTDPMGRCRRDFHREICRRASASGRPQL